MKQLVKDLAERCKDAIEYAAYESYSENEEYHFCGCSCLIDLKGDEQIDVYCDALNNFEVTFYKDNENECANITSEIVQYLKDNANPEQHWQEAYDEDIWKDVEPGCDPAFPHYGDFERWAYGR